MSNSLTYELKFSGLDNILKSINKSSNTLSDRLNTEIKKTKETLNKTLNNIKINPQLKTNEVNKSISDIKAKLKLASKAKVKLDIQNAKAKIWGLKEEIVGVGASVAGILKGVSVGMDFESDMARVKALSGASNEEFIKLQETARKLGENTTFSASESAKGMQYLAMAGFKAKDTIKAMPGLLSLASAGQTDLATTSDIASNILSGFSLKANDMNRVADVMAKTMTSSNTNTQMLGETMKYVSAVASGVGASIEEVSALAGSLGNVGIQGSQAGTSLKAMYSRLSAPPSEALKMLDKLHIKTKDTKGFRGMMSIMTDLEKKLKKLNNAQRLEALKKIFGTEALGGATALIDLGSEKIKKYIKELENAKGTAKKIAEEQNNTRKGIVKSISSVLEGITLSIDNLFADNIKKVLAVIRDFLQQVSKFINTHKTLTKIIGYVIASLVALKTVILSAKVAFYAFKVINGGLIESLLRLPFSCIAFNGSLKDCIKNLKISTIKTKIYTKVNNIATISVNAFKGALSSLISVSKKTILSLITLSRSMILNPKTAAINTFKFAISSMVGGVKKAILALRVFNITILLNPIGLLVGAIAGVAIAVYKYWEPIKAFASGFFEELGKSCKPLKIVFDWIAKGFDWISKVFTNLTEPIKSTKEELASAKNAGVQFAQGIKKAFDYVLTPIKKVYDFVNKLISKIESITGIGKKLKSIGSSVAGLFGSDDKEDKKTDDKKEKKKGFFASLFSSNEEKKEKLAQPVKGAVKKVVENKINTQNQSQSQVTKQINDHKKVNINLYNSQATPKEVSKAIQGNSYYFDE